MGMWLKIFLIYMMHYLLLTPLNTKSIEKTYQKKYDIKKLEDELTGKLLAMPIIPKISQKNIHTLVEKDPQGVDEALKGGLYTTLHLGLKLSNPFMTQQNASILLASNSFVPNTNNITNVNHAGS